MSIDIEGQNHLVELAQLRLSQRSPEVPLERAEIARTVDLLLAVFQELRDRTSPELAVKRLETMFSTFIGQESVLVDQETHKLWLDARRESIEWRLWDRYRKHLIRRAIPPPAVNALDRITDKTLELLGNPAEVGSFNRRGMVVGEVQAGKTSNYTGLICKAADAGYRVVIVLAGLNNNLRSQTQIRLDEGFVGKISMPISAGQPSKTVAVGVGELDSSPKVNWATNRTQSGDFSRRVVRQFGVHPGEAPLLFVVKKNKSVLDSILDWIDATGDKSDEVGRRFGESPLLMIDDEADNASIDTREQSFADGGPDPDHEPTAINARIRRILGRFDQASYVAYTATPFANIFIHPDAQTGEEFQDLFPRDFIINIPADENYVGPTRVFGVSSGEEGASIDQGMPELIEPIEDHAASRALREAHGWMPPAHKSDHIPLFQHEDRVPPSLERAIDSFAVVVAARRARGQERSHNSMMVHVTRFQAVQRRVVLQVQAYLDSLRNHLRYGGEAAMGKLKELWDEAFAPVTLKHSPEWAFLSWEQVASHLRASVESIRIREINGSSADVLDYYENRDVGLNVIAIGGDKLARGLTLEGLSVSYFLRGSRMYDSLMQMGRWFGYRFGYLDLCRLFTTADLLEWYEHITLASEELRQEFDRMETIGASPRDFGLKVRSHSMLMVTSRVKMRHGIERRVAFAGDISETTLFTASEEFLTRNFRAAEDLVRALGFQFNYTKSPRQERSGGRSHVWHGGHYWAGVPVEYILGFLDRYQTHVDAPRANSSLLAKYIRRQNGHQELVKWNVLLVAGEGEEPVRLGNQEVRSVVRQPKGGYGLTSSPIVISAGGRLSIRRLVNPRDEAIDIDAVGYELALEKTRRTPPKRRRATDAPVDQPAGSFLREQRPRDTGLLLLYPLARESEVPGPDGGKVRHRFLDVSQHVVGIGISFPPSGTAEAVSYVVNTVYELEGEDET